MSGSWLPEIGAQNVASRSKNMGKKQL